MQSILYQFFTCKHLLRILVPRSKKSYLALLLVFLEYVCHSCKIDVCKTSLSSETKADKNFLPPLQKSGSGVHWMRTGFVQGLQATRYINVTAFCRSCNNVEYEEQLLSDHAVNVVVYKMSEVPGKIGWYHCTNIKSVELLFQSLPMEWTRTARSYVSNTVDASLRTRCKVVVVSLITIPKLYFLFLWTISSQSGQIRSCMYCN